MSDEAEIESYFGARFRKHFAYLSAVTQFAIASIAMMTGNKLAVASLPLPCTVVIIQALGTLLLLLFFRSQIQTFNTNTAIRWLPIAILFTTMLFTSLKCFVYVGVSTVIIFRNIGAIVTTAVEYFVRGVSVNTRIVLSEVTIVLGAAMYGSGSLDFSWKGFGWIMANVLAQTAYGVTVKKLQDVDEQIREMSKYTMSLYNNSLALPMVLAILFVQKEHETVAEKLEAVTVGGWSIIALTCFFGFLISTSGFGLQKMVSATTFLVINNLTKFVNIAFGMVLLNDKIAGLNDAVGCLVAIGGGVWYSYESMAMIDERKKQKTEECEAPESQK